MSKTQSPIRIAIYCRAGTGMRIVEATHALQQQEQICRDHMKGIDVSHCEVFTDRGSGLDSQRPALNRLLETVKGGQLDLVITPQAPTLTRRMTDFAGFLKSFSNAGTRLLVVENDSSPAWPPSCKRMPLES